MDTNWAKVAAAAAVAALTLGGCSSDDDGATGSEASPGSSASSATAEESTGDPESAAPAPGRTDCSYEQSSDGAPDRDATPPPADQPATGTTAATFTINGGDVPVTFDRAGAPCTVAAVASLVEQGFYDDTPCHRITVSDQPEGLAVLQCGDPTGTGMSGPGFTIQDEVPSGLPPAQTQGASLYERGTVAMAKTASPDSAGSQFFLVYEDSALPPEYAVLGTIDEPGLAVLDRIAEAGAKNPDPGSPDNQVPRDEVRIETAAVTG